MNILLVSSDLLIHSLVSEAAKRCGLVPPKTCNKDVAVPVEDLAAYGIVLVDLSTPGLDVGEAVGVLRGRLRPATPIIAFAPHVHAAKLAAARAAGCQQVLSRGQLDREIDALLKTWSHREPS